MIAIVDYGMGNFGAIANMLRKIGASFVVTSERSKIICADKFILPGVGAFDNAMKNIKDLGIVDILYQRVINEHIPILGICLGMQLLSKKSQEGILPGLGLIDAETIKFRNIGNGAGGFKIPHMGWNSIKIVKESKFFGGVGEGVRFYFAHSYHLKCNDHNDVLSLTNYGYEFVSAVIKDNIFGVQFHPEKSHRFGLQVLKNFADNKC